MKRIIELIFAALISLSLGTVQSQAASDTWISLNSSAISDEFFGGVAVSGRLFLVGQQNFKIYDAAADAWTTLAPSPINRNGFGVAVIEKQLYVVGGYARGDTNILEAYDMMTNTWTTLAPMSAVRNFPAVGAISGKLYVAGGNNSSVALSSLEVYDPTTNGWSGLTPMPTARQAAAAVVVDGKLYVIGGADKSGNHYRNVEVYDPVSNSWSVLAPMPTARRYARAAYVDGKLYVIGGVATIGGRDTLLTANEAYDLGTNTWTTVAPTPTPINGINVGVINSKIYAAGINALYVYSPRVGIEKIFFSSNRANPAVNRFHLWMMNPDGTGLEQLTFGNVIDRRPELSPDGTKLVFHRFIPPGSADIWTLDLITRAETRITTIGGEHPTWSPDGSQIAFNHSSRIWVVDYLPSVGVPFQLSPTSGPSRIWGSWSPDGETILYGHEVGGFNPLTVFKITIATRVEEQVIPWVRGEYDPKYSPDGRRFTWTSFRHSEGGDIYTADIANPLGSQFRVTPFSGFSGGRWSPDGTKLVMVAYPGAGIWAINADGTGLTQLVAVSTGVEDADPWWGDAVLSMPALASAGEDQTIDENVVVALDGSASIGQNLSFFWEQLAGPTVTLNGATSVSPSFTAPQLPGGFGSQVLTFRLTVSNSGGSSTDTVNVTVKNVNHAPEAHAGADQTVNEGSPVALDGSASFDPDGDAITYQWVQTSGTPVSLSGANTATPTFTAPVIPGGVGGVETLSFGLTVSDGLGGLFVVDDFAFGGGGVIKVDPVTGDQTPIISGAAFPTAPLDIVVGGSGKLFVMTQTSSGLVIEVDPLTGAHMVIASGGEFVNPSGLALESNGNLLIADKINPTAGVVDGKIIRINPATSAQTIVSSAGFLLNPFGITVAPNGDILVTDTDYQGGAVIRIDPATGSQTVVSAGGLLTSPSTIAIAANGDIFVGDHDAHIVIRINPSTGAQTVVTSGIAAYGIAIQSNGDILVADPHGSLVRVNPNTGTQTVITSHGNFVSPRRLAIGPCETCLSDTDTVQVVVEQVNHAPVADAGTPQTAHPGTLVTLNGSASQDPDGDPITYQWTQVGGTAVALTGATTATPSFTAPPVSGTTDLTFRLTVSDSSLIGEAEVVITVKNGPPLCNLARAVPGVLWPPNHKMISVVIAGVSDPDDASLTIAVQGVTQDEFVNGLGDGDTSPDAVIQGGSALLRAERSGGGNGRVYRIGFSADDGNGGTCSGSVNVGVPHSMKPGMEAVDDGQLYDSTQP